MVVCCHNKKCSSMALLSGVFLNLLNELCVYMYTPTPTHTHTHTHTLTMFEGDFHFFGYFSVLRRINFIIIVIVIFFNAKISW